MRGGEKRLMHCMRRENNSFKKKIAGGGEWESEGGARVKERQI